MTRFVAIILCLVPGSALADHWAFLNVDGDRKFGHTRSGSNTFSPVFFQCQEGGSILMSAVVGQRRPPSGQGTGTLRAGARSASVSGAVAEFDFDGVYWLEARLDRDHPVFSLLVGGQPTTYEGSGWTRERLSTDAQTNSTNLFLDSCR